MKTLLIISFTIVSNIVFSQGTVLYLGAEKTVAGNQYGGLISFETKKLWSAGAFYQAGINRNEGEETLKNPFFGIALQGPIAKSKRISFFGQVRAGVVNQNFFALVPSFETRIHVTPKAGFSVSAGIRSGYPSLGARLFCKLF